jgi:glycosyltransferase involved in cell wall biosynthesis
MPHRPRIAIVSPFVDKQHGTERCIAEQIERLAARCGYEIHIYSQRIQGVRGVRATSPCITGPSAAEGAGTPDPTRASDAGGFTVWHRVPDIPGPHLVKYLWWFVVNSLCRWWDRRLRGFSYDLVYSPGINCLDADVISVHVVFAEYYRQVKDELRLSENPPRAWARLVHRRLYYRLIMALEHHIYASRNSLLAAISKKTATHLVRHYGRGDQVRVIYHGVDLARFNPDDRYRRRDEARRCLGLSAENFALLLVGNDWKNKGLPCLLEATGQIRCPDLRVLVVGRDDPTPHRALIAHYGLADRVQFLPAREDIEFYYAATDAYVAPSLGEAFGLPPFEAMACGLPVIASSEAGVSELITDGEDGMILNDPRDSGSLAKMILRLHGDPSLCERLGQSAVRTARDHTWDSNADQIRELFEAYLERTAGLSRKNESVAAGVVNREPMN